MDNRAVLEQEAVDTEVEDFEISPELMRSIEQRIEAYENDVRMGTNVNYTFDEIMASIRDEEENAS